MRPKNHEILALLITCILVVGLVALTSCTTPTPKEPTSEPSRERARYEIEPCLPTIPLETQADVIFHNGTIITVDTDFSLTQAIAIKGERILATDCDKNILSLKGNETKVIDLAGKGEPVNVLACVGDVRCVGVQAVDDVAVAGAQGRGKLAVSAAHVNHQAALNAGSIENAAGVGRRGGIGL